MKNTNEDYKYKGDTQQHQYGNEIFDNTETIDTSHNECVINITKEEEALIKWLMSMNLKHHLIQYVIVIVTSCGGKLIELD